MTFFHSGAHVTSEINNNKKKALIIFFKSLSKIISFFFFQNKIMIQQLRWYLFFLRTDYENNSYTMKFNFCNFFHASIIHEWEFKSFSWKILTWRPMWINLFRCRQCWIVWICCALIRYWDAMPICIRTKLSSAFTNSSSWIVWNLFTSFFRRTLEKTIQNANFFWS